MDETEAWLTHWRRGRDCLPQTFLNPCPEVIIAHLCSIGLQCNGTFLQHRSLENRVYACGVVRNDYVDLVQHLSALIAERGAHQQTLRIHGDFGYWNMLWADNRPVVFDFDDMAMGIAAQDLALLMDSLDEQTVRLAERQGIDHSPFIAGYREIRSIDSQCAALLNPLLALRVVHINA